MNAQIIDTENNFFLPFLPVKKIRIYVRITVGFIFFSIYIFLIYSISFKPKMQKSITDAPVRLNSGHQVPSHKSVSADVIFILVTAVIKMALRPGSGGGGRYFSFLKRTPMKRVDLWVKHSPETAAGFHI